MAYFTIQLCNLRFFARHGFYEEEKIVGNEFDVTISLKVKAPKERLSSLQQTVNYAEVYRIAKEIFVQPEPLLETLAQKITEAIRQAFPPVKKIRLQIVKLHPPITAFTGSVGITYQKRYKKS